MTHQSISSMADNVETEAAEWFVKHQGGEASESDVDFQAWLNAAPDNGIAYERCMAAWIMSDVLKYDRDIQGLMVEARKDIAPVYPFRKIISTYIKPMQMAASFIIVIGLASLGLFLFSGDSRYKTHTGQQQIVQLQDGSIVTLNTNTEIQVDYSAKVRRVTLLQGEVYFDVEPDTNRPFVVNVEGNRLHALGTEFNVIYSEEHIEVDVTEGVVAIKSGGIGIKEGENLLATLKLGEAANFIAGGSSIEFEPAEVERINAWREQKIYFKDNRLLDAVQDYNRYLDYEIEILGEDLKEEKVTGVFQTNDTSSFLFTLKHALNIKVRHRPGKVFLYRN